MLKKIKIDSLYKGVLPSFIVFPQTQKKLTTLTTNQFPLSLVMDTRALTIQTSKQCINLTNLTLFIH